MLLSKLSDWVLGQIPSIFTVLEKEVTDTWALWPVVCLQPLARRTPVHTHVGRARSPSLLKHQKWDWPCSSGKGHGQRSVSASQLFRCSCAFPSTYPCVSPNHIESIIFSAFGTFGSCRPVRSLLQAQNALPMDPRKCHTSLGQDLCTGLPQSGRCSELLPPTPLNGCHTWPMGLWVSRESPRKSPDRVSPPPSSQFVFLPVVGPLCSSGHVDMSLWRAEGSCGGPRRAARAGYHGALLPATACVGSLGEAYALLWRLEHL